jgi:hypothetical protein
LLKAGDLAKPAGNVRGHGSRRSHHVRLDRAEADDQKTGTAECAENAEKHLGSALSALSAVSTWPYREWP